ncbi:hypothetical protein [Brevundimonas lenta]|uniref:Uncharacterized protein n=1 Tax=Brevundimonas lenta TaxID=424796 RepID=A0A7W6NN99_9CAUL|nr:hypothetical protein [Brevundimonas lenta]MBB4081573.1 hypothetical protein [Brevundimonas lenta]
MWLLTGFFVLFALNGLAFAMALYVDHRARRRIRARELPASMPWLLQWFGWGIDPFYLFSPAFPRLQDRTTRWLVWPLRIAVGANVIAVGAVVAVLLGWIPG